VIFGLLERSFAFGVLEFQYHLYQTAEVVCTENLNPEVVVMKSSHGE
jgi:hypothetical protein